MSDNPGAVPKLRIASALGLGALAALLAGCSSGTDDSQAAAPAPARNVALTAGQRAHIRLYTVAPLPYRRSVEATGTVDYDNDQATAIVSPFSGAVTRVLVSLGQHVAKGQPLALVNSADYAAALGAYRKAVVTARNARRVAETDRDLAAHQGIPQREAAQAQTDAAAAEADRDAAQQGLAALNVGSGTLRGLQAGRAVGGGAIIRAPIAGTIVDKQVTPGQLLQAGTTAAFTVANLSRVWVLAQVASADLAAVAVGDPAEVDTGTGFGALAGRVDNIGAAIDPNTRAAIARVVLDNPRGVLKKQMYVSVSIRAGRESLGLLAPVSAVLRDDENLPFVYVALSDGSFARRHVTLGYRDGDRYDIAEGLRAGDRVVVDGALFLQFMQAQ